MQEKTHAVLFASNEYFEFIFSRDFPANTENQVHQQRALDLCGPFFQLITRYTHILDSRSQTSALEGQRPRPRASRTGFRGIVETS